MWAIIKKEVKSYFYSPIGYIFIGLFLAMYSLFFYTDVYYYGSVNFEYMFYSSATVLTFIVPILTMRIFAEERKTGTEQLLLTAPRSVTSIVLAKFIAGTVIILLSELFTFMYFGILMQFGEPHLSTALTTLLGFLLLGMAYIALGTLASSITENQIIAGVITMATSILLWFLPNIYSGFAPFSPVSAFTSCFPRGTIALPSVVLLVSFTVMCLALTVIVLQRRKSIK